MVRRSQAHDLFDPPKRKLSQFDLSKLPIEFKNWDVVWVGYVSVIMNILMLVLQTPAGGLKPDNASLVVLLEKILF